MLRTPTHLTVLGETGNLIINRCRPPMVLATPDTPLRLVRPGAQASLSGGKLSIVLKVEEFDRLRRLVECLRTWFVPPLTMLDVVCLASTAFSRILVVRCHPRGKPADVKLIGAIDNIAVTAVQRAHPTGFQESGLLPKLIIPRKIARHLVAKKYWNWRTELSGIIEAVSARNYEVSIATRAGFVFALWELLICNTPPIVVDEFRAALDRWQRQVYGRALSGDESNPVRLAADFRLLLAERPGARVSFVGEDGRYHVNQTGVRDALGRTRRADQSPDGTQERLPIEAERHEGSADTEPSPAEVLAVAEDGRAARRAIESLRARSLPPGRAGRAYALVLREFERLSSGDVTAAELARAGGLSEAAISQARCKVRNDLARRMGRAGTARGFRGIMLKAADRRSRRRA